MSDPSHLVLLLLQQWLNRAQAERHKQARDILELLRRVRQRQAEREFEQMESFGKKLPRTVDFDDLPF